MANRLVEIISTQAKRYGDREAYRFCWRKDGEWLPTSWNEFKTQVEVSGKALAGMGLLEKDTIAICSPNTPQILITEFGAFRNRVTVIPIYSSSSQEQFDFIVGNGEAKVVFVGDSHQYPLAYNYWKKHPGAIRRIVVFKNDELELRDDDTVTIFWDDFVRLGMDAGEDIANEVERRMSESIPEDMATLIYTSGTTGEPKGVAITHSNYDAAIEKHLQLLHQVKDTDLSMSFLPMSHILEKAWSFFCVTKGIAIAVNYDPRLIQDTIHDVHPNIMCCVPRFWEKVYAGVKEKIAAMGRIQRIMVNRALKCGKKRNIDYVRRGRQVPWLLDKEYDFWNKRIFSKLKHAIGIPNPNMFPTAGAPLSDRIVEFLRSVGIERVKDLFKTSNGKYVAPQMLESRLAENKYIDEVAVIGDQRKFVTALIVPNLSQLRRWAEEKGVDYSDTESFVANPDVVKFMLGEINKVQQGVAEYEKIKRITLLPHHFSIMNGEVTNTMKVRRPIVARRYAKEIEAMYAY